MTIKIIDIANRFLSGDACSRQELNELKSWLSSPASQSEVESWLSAHWENSDELNSGALIESVYAQIEDYLEGDSVTSTFSWKQALLVYQKIAAVLLIPMIGLGILYGISRSGSGVKVQYSETFAPRGQKSQIVLPDGTKVWLNSDTKIRYPGQFDQEQRDIYLEGEAFFEVSRDADRPFFVHCQGPDVKVTGTKFNVRAYADENQVETSLFEGKVEWLLKSGDSDHPVAKELKPGQSFLYNGNSGQLVAVRFPEDEINGWKKNQLIFKDDTFVKLVKKIERWYNVQVIYDERKFDKRRLTVELYEGERLEKLMDILSLALSVDYRYEKGKIVLTPKNS
jgi:ferric-dicitrate binding protein FerR (iron transport regulator)